MINILRALSLLLGLLVVTEELFGAQHESEGAQTLEAAVRAGRTGEVDPYLLLQSADGRSKVGAVYTQFVRVARYVWLQNRQIELADIPDYVKRRELHVVLPIPLRIGDDGPTMAAIDRPPSARPAGVAAYFVQSARRLTPAIAVIAPAAFEQTVGAIPTERPGLVGMFAPEIAQRKVPEFCAYDADRVGNVGVVCGYVAGPLR
jgi:hypothetical protein